FKLLAAEKGLEFRLRGSRLRVDSDMKLLRRVLQNFLTNALRYGKSPILLGARRQGERLWLEVWDRGPGIADDKLQVIFQEFKRLDSHQTRAEKGLGLGLAIADGLCRVLGHPLEVRSWPGKGTVFRVSVPIARQAAAAPSAPVEQQGGQPLAGLHVLCVDNEDSILIGMNSLLSRWGCQVWTARNQAECEALLAKGMRPHLALVDYHLDDGETGTGLMGWLRARLGEPVPGVVISADGSKETIALVHASGLDYLAKPVKPAALRALLNRHLSLAQ
ncbi:MAG: hybrid sensor histidine kinase/response regulator, partial [Pseudomonas alloputida]